MKQLYYALLLLLLATQLPAQGENNIWPFGSNYSLDFNTNPPTLKDSTYINNHPAGTKQMHIAEHNYRFAVAVCNARGELQFIVKKVQPSTGDGACIFDRFEKPIAGTAFPFTQDPSESKPLVIPHPGNSSQYYIFYARNNGLLYSLFDMTLNGGLGNVVPGQHNVLFSGYNTVFGHKMTSVQGCSGVWLVVRSMWHNQYFSFHVDRAGLHTTPVVSECGLLPVKNYRGCVMKPSPDGRLMASAQGKAVSAYDSLPGGLELYDFEPCSGRLKNARLLDTNVYVYGVCFSPDNSKLYATYNIPEGLNNRPRGHVYQFDLSFQDIDAIINSKERVLTNPINIVWDVWCPPTEQSLTDMKLGPDGKIYMTSNHEFACPGRGPGMTLHRIDRPNNRGMACLPQIDAVYNKANGMGELYLTDLSYDITPAPSVFPDTTIGTTYEIEICFKDSAQISALDNRECYHWNNDAFSVETTVYKTGDYWVHYFQDCSITVDTYRVTFVPMPEVQPLQYGCQGDITLRTNGKENVVYHYTLVDENGNVAAAKSGSAKVEIPGLDAGSYQLRINTPSGCDTTVSVILSAYPGAEISVYPSDTTIRYGDTIRLKATGTQVYKWSPAATLEDDALANPLAWPLKSTVFMVVGTNEYGCRDTGFVKVNIDFYLPDLIPNAFSPNGDGINDYFRIEGITYQQVRSFTVYNRYSQPVFNTMDAATGWDGNMNGKPCDPGTYYYLIQLAYPDGQSKTFKGDVHLIR